MARLRTIKAEFFTNEDLAECSAFARLLFIGLWCNADCRGVLEDRPKRLKMAILPTDDVNVDSLLGELNAFGLIIRYESEGVRGIYIPKFLLHQTPHTKERENGVPMPGSTVLAPVKPGASPVKTGPAPVKPGFNRASRELTGPAPLVNWDVDSGKGRVGSRSSEREARAPARAEPPPGAIRDIFQAFMNGIGVDETSPDYLALEARSRPAFASLIDWQNPPETITVLMTANYLAERYKQRGIRKRPDLKDVLAALGEYEQWEADGRPEGPERDKNGNPTAEYFARKAREIDDDEPEANPAVAAAAQDSLAELDPGGQL